MQLTNKIRQNSLNCLFSFSLWFVLFSLAAWKFSLLLHELHDNGIKVSSSVYIMALRDGDIRSQSSHLGVYFWFSIFHPLPCGFHILNWLRETWLQTLHTEFVHTTFWPEDKLTWWQSASICSFDPVQGRSSLGLYTSMNFCRRAPCVF